jgi:hypothetical protein
MQSRDETFGHRHFITADPNGVLIDIIKPIPPSAYHAASYAGDAVPQCWIAVRDERAASEECVEKRRRRI